jgi:uncharacterized protein (DUF885 family)
MNNNTSPTPTDKTFEQLAKKFVAESPGYSPVGATWLGDHRFDAQLDEISPEARRRKAAFWQSYLQQLSGISMAELSPANRVDAAMLEHHLRANRWHMDTLQEWAWNPLGYSGLAGNAIYTLMARDFAPIEERLRNAGRRLEHYPRLLEQVRGTLDPSRTPNVHAETAVKQNRGIKTIIETMLRPQADLLPPSDRSRLQRAMETASQAIDTHQRWLEEELRPKAAGNFRIGAGLYDQKLPFALCSPLTREEIRRSAEAELRRVRHEMYEIAASLHEQTRSGRKTPANPTPEVEQDVIASGLELAYRETPDPARIVETATEMLAKATSFVTNSGLVSVPPDPCEVIVMPEFRRGVSLAYCDSPGPLDVGQRTFYAISPPPADWTEEQVRSLLREYNLRSLHNLTVHEAMPGHFLQLAHANRYPSTLRAMLSSGVFIEGWAVYTEHLMVEQGFAEGDLLMRLVVLKWYLRGIANALLDQAVHVDGMEEAEAMRLMTRDTFQEEREAAGKWVRAQLTSTQLPTYFVGYQEHVRLRREMEQTWGTGFSLRKYHDALLSFGSPPTQHVRALLLNP